MEVSDPKAIRALAHPVRLDLLELLIATGPATAAQCGRLLGVSQASCSFHLRQLAKYGFVEDAGPGQDRRERQWRAVHQRLRLRGHDVAGRRLTQFVVERELQTILEHADRQDSETPEWRGLSDLVTGVAVMTATEAAAMKEQLLAMLAPYFRRAVGSGLRLQPGERYVRYFLAATPLAELIPPKAGQTPPKAGQTPTAGGPDPAAARPSGA